MYSMAQEMEMPWMILRKKGDLSGIEVCASREEKAGG
jgi:hypothetical protein